MSTPRPTSKRPDDDEEEEVLEGEVVDESAGAAASDPDADLEGQEPGADVLAAEEVVVPDVLPVKIARGGAALAPRVASSDPLQAYMRDVQRYSLLTPEETHELAVKYQTSGDLEAAKKLVTSNLRLVVKIAFDYRRAYKNILDLVQEGNIGLMQAVKKYDPYRGVKLSSYAAWWIRAYMLRFILNNWRLVKLGTTQAQRKLFFNLKKEKARLSALGIDPTPELIAQNLDVTTEEVEQMDRRLSSGEASLDAPAFVGSEGASATSRVETLPSEGALQDEQLAEGEMKGLLTAKIHEYGKTLAGKDKIIFDERLMSDEPKTLQELGERFGVSRERVRQIEKRLTQKIRAYLQQEVEGSGLP